jgi:hypothetical protein
MNPRAPVELKTAPLEAEARVTRFTPRDVQPGRYRALSPRARRSEAHWLTLDMRGGARSRERDGERDRLDRVPDHAQSELNGVRLAEQRIVNARESAFQRPIRLRTRPEAHAPAVGEGRECRARRQAKGAGRRASTRCPLVGASKEAPADSPASRNPFRSDRRSRPPRARERRAAFHPRDGRRTAARG